MYWQSLFKQKIVLPKNVFVTIPLQLIKVGESRYVWMLTSNKLSKDPVTLDISKKELCECLFF